MYVFKFNGVYQFCLYNIFDVNKSITNVGKFEVGCWVHVRLNDSNNKCNYNDNDNYISFYMGVLNNRRLL